MNRCIIKSDNHSDDLIHVMSGNPYSIPVCGFHEMMYRNTQTIYAKARTIAEKESEWIVYTEDKESQIKAEIKKTQRAAKMAYNKIGRSEQTHELKEYGYARVNDADPKIRKAVGLDSFPKMAVPIS